MVIGKNSIDYHILSSLFNNLKKHTIDKRARVLPLEKKNVLHTSIFSLSQVAIKHQLDYVIICDDFEFWQLLQSMSNKHHKITFVYTAIKALYSFYKKPSLLTCVEFLRQNLFFKEQDKWMAFELKVRQQEIKYIAEIISQLPAVVIFVFQNTHLPFKSLYSHILELFDAHIQTQLMSFQMIIDFIDQDCNLEWANGLIMLASANPSIKWGLNHALCHKPEEVFLALTQPKIPKLTCGKCIDNVDAVFLAKWQSWRNEKKLVVHACIQERDVLHPLIESLQLLKSSVCEVKIPEAIANPPIHTRPRTISATALRQLMQNPYGFYAKYILGLKSLPCIWTRPTPKDFGILVHHIIEQILENNFSIKDIENYNVFFSLWNNRIEKIIQWVQAQMQELSVQEIFVEKEIMIEICSQQIPINLSARIDTFLKTLQGNLTINFKTGQPPLKQDVISGYEPQLAIEMYLGAVFFKEPCQGEFWYLKGTQPVGSVVNIPLGYDYIEQQISRIAHHYLLTQSPFFSCPWPLKKPKYDQYFHLERRQ